MESPFQTSDIETGVIQCMARVFGMAPEEITLQSSLVNDLGADSLDHVELRALLEKRFGITLPLQSVLEHAARLTGEEARFVQAGRVTREGAELLWKSPYAFTEAQVREGSRPRDLVDAMTVANWAALCEHLTRALPPVCPACGHAQAVLNPQSRLACGACARPLALPLGDATLAALLAKELHVTTD